MKESGITRGFYEAFMDYDVEGAYSGNPRPECMNILTAAVCIHLTMLAIGE